MCTDTCAACANPMDPACQTAMTDECVANLDLAYCAPCAAGMSPACITPAMAFMGLCKAAVPEVPVVPVVPAGSPTAGRLQLLCVDLMLALGV